MLLGFVERGQAVKGFDCALDVVETFHQLAVLSQLYHDGQIQFSFVPVLYPRLCFDEVGDVVGLVEVG